MISTVFHGTVLYAVQNDTSNNKNNLQREKYRKFVILVFKIKVITLPYLFTLHNLRDTMCIGVRVRAFLDGNGAETRSTSSNHKMWQIDLLLSSEFLAVT